MRRLLTGVLLLVVLPASWVRADELLPGIDNSAVDAATEPVLEEKAGYSLLGLDLSGWTELSFTAGTADGDHRPMGFNHRSNEFLLQQNWLRVDGEFDGGTRVHSDWILPGSDYQFTRATGLFDDQDGWTGIDPVQFFVSREIEGVGEGLELTFGRFFAPFGVESIAGPENTLVSHSYSFIYNPFTQTGGLARVAVNENFVFRGGIGFHWDLEDDRTSVDFLAISGNGRYDSRHEIHSPRVFDLVITRKVSETVEVTLEGLGGYEKNFPGVGTAHWFSGVGYVAWGLQDDIDAAIRLELFNDEHGNRTGSRGLYTALAGGLAWRWNDHLLVRPELRVDHNTKSRPFAGDRMLFTATVDLVIHW